VFKLTLNVFLNSQPANGVSANTAQATVLDDTGVSVANAEVNFSVTADGVTPAHGATDANGQALSVKRNKYRNRPRYADGHPGGRDHGECQHRVCYCCTGGYFT